MLEVKWPLHESYLEKFLGYSNNFGIGHFEELGKKVVSNPENVGASDIWNPLPSSFLSLWDLCGTPLIPVFVFYAARGSLGTAGRLTTMYFELSWNVCGKTCFFEAEYNWSMYCIICLHLISSLWSVPLWLKCFHSHKVYFIWVEVIQLNN